MKTWQEILNGKSQPSNVIEEEIKTLTSSGQELEACLPELQKSLGEARKSLLADSPTAITAIEKVQEAEKALSENRNKIAAVSDILRELGEALKVALAAEKENRQSEIIREIAVIDEQMAGIRLEIVSHFAKAAVLYKGITGGEYYRLSNDFFENYGLSSELRRRISEGSSDEVPLHRQREALQSESIRLRKSP